ncbi:ribosomal protein L34 [Aminomonas paucivorans DSM 12260]|uniref:Large ribosomal subunit protein bL34 n=1 Tax=Aminomonas paucivorans DSM 12260 TaxID=584708 RepID=E3CXH3_9BACT|nr:ribosomal protein L34 [Aminomonas paucivorans DSM 12260]
MPRFGGLCYSIKAFPKGSMRVTTSKREVSPVKRTYQPHNVPRKRSMGFLERSASPSGRNILRNRRRKGRKRLAV